jgi:uncharacterized protein (TIGR03435 family)
MLSEIDRPVLDRTGLSGYFDLQLNCDHGPFCGIFERPSRTDGVSFFTAVKEQLGLRLVAGKAPRTPTSSSTSNDRRRTELAP